MVFFRFLLCALIGCVFLESSDSIAGSKLPCRLRNSSYCKNPKYFERDKRDGCANPRSNCREKFCNYNCFGATAPEKSIKTGSIHSLCQANCSAEEFVNISRPNRLLFQERFLDRALKRRGEADDYARKVRTNLLAYCNEQCNYEEENPSCVTKLIKKENSSAWNDCAQKCHFIKDIKDHAEHCSQKKQRPIPKPRPKKVMNSSSTPMDAE